METKTFEQILEDDYHIQLEDNRRDESMKLAAQKFAAQFSHKGDVWVSVDDDLPKVSGYYLILTTAGVDKVWFNAEGKYFGQHKDFKWLPNYWMSLPAPPIVK